MSSTEPQKERYVLEKTLSTPAHIASLAFGHASHLFAGSDDGSLRVYDLSNYKVLKAIRGLGTEVSSIICMKRPGSELRDAWVAHGQQVSKFQLDSEKIIQSPEDAITTIQIGEAENEILNELALNADKSHLAFSLDSGHVGVIELSSNTVSRMEKQHDSICGSVRFIPDRPRELVSGGYDTQIFHFDFAQKKLLADRHMDPYDPVGGMALAPPFVMSMAVSSSGILAAGTADGRLWVGFGGERSAPPGGGPKKKTKKWQGLDEATTLMIKVAEGPIVAMAFSDSRLLSISTLMGVVTQYRLVYEEGEGNVVLQQLWQKETDGLAKVNALLADEKRIILGGFGSDGKGVIEIWKEQFPAPPPPPTTA